MTEHLTFDEEHKKGAQMKDENEVTEQQVDPNQKRDSDDSVAKKLPPKKNAKERKKKPAQKTYTEERLPLITTSMWVRLNNHKSVPEGFRGRDAVVVLAPTERHEADDHCPTPYEVQDEDTVFVVRERDTSQLIELKREAFDWYGPTQPLGALPTPIEATPPDELESWQPGEDDE